ncbi:nuclear poly(A) polymerase 4-like [Alnus glutinosa]|uniref:nuclear poly(A) polymerase 4-like n=1 Tax=Alnus glutinosa TaxID=3517 RepID=UPI002D796DC5|nr:nuclear poly(A) polymerase 4-like [Alnus glutinosa]
MDMPIYCSISFSSWGHKIEDPKNDTTFKVNGQRLKPFLELISSEIETTLLEDPSYSRVMVVDCGKHVFFRISVCHSSLGERSSTEIELKKAQWSALFEPYLFFEAYKNYLHVDIVAADADADDLLAWKGWVESRFRQLTLKIERDTNGMLQCHPYPNEYVDASKPCPYCAFFMGLQRKEGVRGQEGQQFDIRGTVDEFRQDINMYMFWKPGMDIFVSHVRRKQLPAFVFPDGYKRSRLSRHGSQQAEKTCEDDVGCWSGSAERRLKRKYDPETVDVKPEKPEKRVSISPQPPELVTPESRTSRSGGVSQVSFSEGVKIRLYV